MALALGAATALALSPSARAAPASQELADARSRFRAGAYPDAIAALSALLYPQSRLSDPAELAEAHLLLGVSYFETGRRESAARELDSALFLDRTLTIEAGLFSEDAVAFFDAKKKELERRAQAEEERTRLARERAAIRRFLASAVVVEKRNYLLNFVPFGTGQFQNGQRGKGMAFAISQGVLAGGSIGLASYQVIRYGLSGKVPREEVDAVRRIQVLQVAAGAAFYGLWVWSVVDALANYEPAVRRELDPATQEELEKLYREEEREPAPTRAPASREGGAHLLPLLGPDAAGAALSWEF
jgi:tetratricopeptide (TPR) repeat protein